VKKRLWFSLHGFLGVTAGLVLFVICWSGTVATIADELDWVVTPELRIAESTTEVRWNRVHATLQESTEPEWIDSVHVPMNPYAAVRAEIEPPEQPEYLVYLHPRTGEKLGEFSELTIQEFFRGLHRHLFLPKPTGIVLVSLFAIALLIMAISALMFLKRWWVRFLQLRLFTRQGHIAWGDLHRTAGLWSLWFVILMAVIGIWYGLEATGIPDALLEPDQEPAALTEAALSSEPLPLGTLVARAQAARPQLEIREVEWEHDKAGIGLVRVQGQAQDWLVRDRVNYVSLTQDGRLMNTGSGSDLSAYAYWVNMADPLHFGSFAGLPTKFLWFGFGLILCGIILTGTWLHARRLARHPKGPSKLRWPGTMPACAASLILLAMAVPFGIAEMRAYGALGGATEPAVGAPIGVVTFITAWLALTITIIACWLFLLWRPVPPGAARMRGH
jgi:uncharacterized iron-regulated membrane protein